MYFLKQEIDEVEESVETEYDWSIPLDIRHDKDKTMFYAWDKSGVFVGQDKTIELLLTNASERYNIPKDKFYVNNIELL